MLISIQGGYPCVGPEHRILRPTTRWGKLREVNTPFAQIFDRYDVWLSGMRVTLRHPGIGLYYASRKHWVGDADSALDLETVERAAELSRDESFEQMDIVVTYDDSTRELVLPIRRKTAGDAEPLRPAG